MPNINSQKGFAVFFIAILVIAITLASATSIFITTYGEQKISQNIVKSSQAYYAAEAGIEDAVYRIKKSMNIFANYNMQAASALVDVAVNSPTQNSRVITANGNANNIMRRLETRLTIAVITPDFFYGAQVGDLGIVMDNNSRIEGVGGVAGNIYSNGSISGDSGATITGDVVVAMGSQPTSLDEVIVWGNAYAHTITQSKICGSAFYQVIDSDSLNFLNNPSHPACSDPLTPGIANSGNPDSPLQNMPISDSDINQWKLEAANGGVHNGNLAIISDMSYGPKKIDGNLIVTSNNKTLTVAGTIYVTGYIDIDNGSTIRCQAVYGQNSCVVIADKWIHIKNNGIFRGSGEAGSYIMLLSASQCDGTSPIGCTDHNAAMDLHNNAEGAIFYANDGLIYLHNGVTVSEITAKKIHLENNAIIRYEQGLASASFSAGPGAGWQIESWKEIE